MLACNTGESPEMNLKNPGNRESNEETGSNGKIGPLRAISVSIIHPCLQTTIKMSRPKLSDSDITRNKSSYTRTISCLDSEQFRTRSIRLRGKCNLGKSKGHQKAKQRNKCLLHLETGLVHTQM